MKIVLVNQSPIFTSLAPAGDELALIAKACAEQVVMHLCLGAWQCMPVEVDAGTDADPTDPEVWPIVLFDDGDQAGVLGYHTLSPQGRPYGRVFVRPVTDAGGDLFGPMGVAPVVSHEVCETVVDPNINMWADDGTGRLYAVEVCDPVEGDSYAVEVQRGDEMVNVYVSNFVTEHWFNPTPPADTPFDAMAKLSKPFEMSAGGYFVYRDGGTVGQIFAHKMSRSNAASKAHPAARTAKRTRSIKVPLTFAAVTNPRRFPRAAPPVPPECPAGDACESPYCAVHGQGGAADAPGGVIHASSS